MRAKLATLPPLLTTLGVNAVPFLGYFGAGWSAELTMIVFLCENFVLSLLTALKVRWLAKVEVKFFLLVALGFSFACAVFVAVFLFGFGDTTIDPDRFVQGLLGITGFHALGFVWDAFALRGMTKPQADLLLERALGRVFVLYAGVFAGVIAAYFVSEWFVGPFIVLKTVIDVGSTIAQTRALFQARNAGVRAG
jgi:Family of unknown function (DUF6498)